MTNVKHLLLEAFEQIVVFPQLIFIIGQFGAQLIDHFLRGACKKCRIVQLSLRIFNCFLQPCDLPSLFAPGLPDSKSHFEQLWSESGDRNRVWNE